MTRSKLTQAREQLAAAHEDSLNAPRLASDAAQDAQEHLFDAELKLRQVGRVALASELKPALEGDVTAAAARQRIRDVADALDSELSPEPSFRAASDGGARE